MSSRVAGGTEPEVPGTPNRRSPASTVRLTGSLMDSPLKTDGELVIASVRRRLAAGVISAVLSLAPAGAVVALVLGTSLRSVRWLRRPPLDRMPRAPQRLRRSSDRPWPAWLRIALGAASAAVQVRTRNLRGPGARLLRLRRVDLVSGGPVTVRSALVSGLFDWAWQAGSKRLLAPLRRRQKARIDALEPELEALRAQHEDDEAAHHRAIAELYARHGINPLMGCLPGLGLACLRQAPILFSPRRQSLSEHLAGTVVIVEPRR